MSPHEPKPGPAKQPEEEQSPTVAAGDAAFAPTPDQGELPTAFNSHPPAAERTTTRHPEIDGYEILEKIAQGGMGVVYRARQIKLNRIVALKVIRSGNLATSEQVARFYSEAEAAGGLDHPAIVPVYDVGESNGQHYYSMAFVEGHSLADLLGRRVLDCREAAEILLVLSEAMDFAHAHNVIHRDLKPANVLLAEGSGGSTGHTSSNVRHKHGSVADRSASRSGTGSAADVHWLPKITDFGLAKRTECESELTSTGQILGTPSYMPPEQIEGSSEVAAAADVYALGAILYATLTGRPPFQSPSAMETLRQVVERDPIPPTRLNPAIDRDLETICLKCLEKKPGSRYESARALADDVHRYLGGEPISARPISSPERLWRWCRRKPATAISLAALTTLAAALIAVALIGSQLRYSRQLAETQAAKLEAGRKEQQLKDAELENARKLARERAKLAETQRYYGLLGEIRSSLADRRVGWAFDSLARLKEAARLNHDGNVVDHLELRNLATQLLAGPDVELIQEIRMPLGYRSHRVGFHPDGRYLAIATLKNRIRLRVLLCDPKTGKIIHDLAAPASIPWQFKATNLDGIRIMAFIAAGKELAVLTRSGWIYIWDLDTSPPKRRHYKFPREGLDEAVFHPFEPAVYYADGKTLRRWSWESGKPPDSFGESVIGGDFDRIAIDPTGRFVAATNGDSIVSFDAHALTPLHEPALNLDVGEMTFNPDGRLLAFTGGPQGGMILETTTGRVVGELSAPASTSLHGEPVSGIDWSGDGSWIVTTSRDRRACLWDITSGSLALAVGMPGSDPPQAAVDSFGHYLATTGEERVRLYRLVQPRVRGVIGPFADEIGAIDVGDRSKLTVVAIPNRDGPTAISLIDPSNNTVITTQRIDAVPHDVAVADRSPVIAITDRHDKLWIGRLPDDWSNLSHDELADRWRPDTWHVHAAAGPSRVALDPAGSKAWLIFRSRKLRIYSLQQNSIVSEWDNSFNANFVGTGTFKALAVQSHLAAVTADDEILRLFHDGKLKHHRNLKTTAFAVAITPDEEQVLCGLNQGRVVVLSPDGDELFHWQAHQESIQSIAVSDDGQLVATASNDRSVRLWQRTDKQYQHLVTLPREPVVIQRVRFCGDLLLVVPHGTRYARTWNWRQLVEYWKASSLLDASSLQDH